ncbi:MAG: hypothetical protein HGA31_02440, partial [Candidatus Moranbacteria bacterium]|nr:hypothetical protein [Candidatus Moranbacteria bacterium]
MERNRILVVSGLVILLTLLSFGAIVSIPLFRSVRDAAEPVGNILQKGKEPGVGKFASEEEFRQYLSQGQSLGYGSFRSGAAQGFGAMDVGSTSSKEGSAMSFANPLSMTTSPSGASDQSALRVSETNVRTEGVDEPDIVKTDGSHIYYSREPRYLYRGGPEPVPMLAPAADGVTAVSGSAGAGVTDKIGFMPPYQPVASTDIFSVSAAGEAALLGTIGKTGETLLFGNTLVLFESSGRSVTGYDISDRKNPKEKWAFTIADNGILLEARKSGDKLYLVERTWVNTANPCPIRTMTSGTTSSEIACTDIYRPGTPVSSVDSVFLALFVDPQTGTIGDTVAFTGSSGQTVAYMSTDSLFITYDESIDPILPILDFFRENGDLFSVDFRARLERLSGYDIGPEAKSMEFGRLFQNELLGKGQDEQLRLQNEMTNRMADYGKKHLRDFGRTGIVKISLRDFSIGATGSVPGVPLNDYSLDESDGSLRIATTVGGNRGSYLPMVSTPNDQSENDVYVLDRNLGVTGQLLGLGAGERIYSARFIGDRGYLVTFKETDPFYVLDLSDPEHPKKTGELKIPGYSSYLHPLGPHIVLGIGREESKVKLSLFDVSDP